MAPSAHLRCEVGQGTVESRDVHAGHQEPVRGARGGLHKAVTVFPGGAGGNGSAGPLPTAGPPPPQDGLEAHAMFVLRPPLKGRVRMRLLQRKMATEDELKKIDQEVRAIVNDASEFATQDPEPDPSELWTDVVRQ